jgi:putative oxidoreductase
MAVITGRVEIPSTVDSSTVDRGPRRVVERAAGAAARWLAGHSVTTLRVSLGLVFLGFGALKFVPGTSPAEALVMRTIDTLSLGLVSGTPAVLITAVLETFIGLTLITGIGLRAGLAVMAGSMVGIMSPLVLFFGDLFPGLVPTLEAQYVLKDIVLVAAGAVVAAHALGARYVLVGKRRSG